MKSKGTKENWSLSADKVTLIHELIPFLKFLEQHELTKEDQKKELQKIQAELSSIQTQRTLDNWCVSLELFTPDIEYKRTNDVCWRRWDVEFTEEKINIIAESWLYEDDGYPFEGHFYFNETISYKAEEPIEEMKLPISAFVKDALNYKKYTVFILKEVAIYT